MLNFKSKILNQKSQILTKFVLAFFCIIFLVSCLSNDKEKIIGKWQCDQDWFEYFSDGTYNTGKSIITMGKGFRYSIDGTKKELNMYTNSQDQTYYMKYVFIGEDTLSVRNILSTNDRMVKFYRVKK